jgi:hypothetical protein
MIGKLRLCVVAALLAAATLVEPGDTHAATPTSTPTITTISPSTVYVNTASFTLTVIGTNFVSGAVVFMGYSGSPLTTTFVSSTKLTAEVPASYLTSTYTYSVYVTNPGNLTSNSVSFYVVALDPSISSVSPFDVVAGTVPGIITVSGNNFASGASILWNRAPVSTTFVNPNELEFTPTKAQLGAARIVQLAVSNPTPGGTSSTIDFDVTYPAKVTTLDLPANDIVWDPYVQRIYASLPSSYGSKGNTIAVVNPYTGKILKYYFAGSEPNQLALSYDSKYLYVGLNGNGSVQRLVLPGFTPDIDVPLTGNGFGESVADSLGVSPSDDHTFAVAEGSLGCCGTGGLYFYKDSTQLANSITYPQINDLVFASGSTLYGYYSGTVTDIAVDSNGGTLAQQWNGLVQGSAIAYAGGLIYGNGGQVLNPSTGLLVGTYDVIGGCCYGNAQIVPDPAVDRVFAVGNTPFLSTFGITAYDLQKFTPIAATDLSQFNGSSASPAFLHWGNNGLAFVLTVGCCGNNPPQLVIVQSPPMFATGSKDPVPKAKSLSPSSVTHGAGNLLVSITGTNFVPNSQVTWNGSLLFADYVSQTQLNLYVPAARLSVAGTASVVVTNPAPGGGTSTPLTFTVN